MKSVRSDRGGPGHAAAVATRPPRAPVLHVGIGHDELLGERRRVGAEDENRAVDRIADCSGHHDLAALVALANHLQVLRTIRRAPVHHVVDDIVEKNKGHSSRQSSVISRQSEPRTRTLNPAP
jgi:hypothetical protein